MHQMTLVEHDGTEFPIAFLSHTFSETQRKWCTMEQEAYGVYYAITKWNYYLQGTDIIVWNDHKPLNKFLNGKNANNKVIRWGLELATYNITFEWISGAHNKTADCLSCLVEPLQNKPVSINMLAVTWLRWTCFPHQKLNLAAPVYWHSTSQQAFWTDHLTKLP